MSHKEKKAQLFHVMELNVQLTKILWNILYEMTHAF